MEKNDSKITLLNLDDEDDAFSVCYQSDMAYLTGLDNRGDEDSIHYSLVYTSKTNENGIEVFTNACCGKAYRPTGIPISCLDKRVGIRPVMLLSDEEYKLVKESSVYDYDLHNWTVEYGEYPQYIPSLFRQTQLNMLAKLKKLKMTGNSYTVNGDTKNNAFFRPETYNEYEFGGHRYIHVKVNLADPAALSDHSVCHPDYAFASDSTALSSNLSLCLSKKYIWVEVSKVEWYLDDNKKALICDSVLLSGIAYNNSTSREEKIPFENSDMFNFLNAYMLPDIIQNEKKSYRLDKVYDIIIDYQKYTSSYIPMLISRIKNQEININLLTDEQKKSLTVILANAEPNDQIVAKIFVQSLGYEYLLIYKSLTELNNKEDKKKILK